MTKLRGGEGILAQAQKDFVTLRLLVVPSGNLTPVQLKLLAEVAEKEGKGYIIFTSRKGVEVPWIPFEKAQEISRKFEMAGLPAGSCGKKVRAVVTCAGTERCPFVLFNVDEFCKKISERHYGRATPAKFKIAMAGCPNYCSNPYIDDFGIIGAQSPRIIPERCIGCGNCARICRGRAITQKNGDKNEVPVIDDNKCIICGWCIKNCPADAIETIKQGFTIVVGGKSGRKPRLADKIAEIVTEEEFYKVLERTIEYSKKNAKGAERLCNLIDRLGLENFKAYVLEGIDGGRR